MVFEGNLIKQISLLIEEQREAVNVSSWRVIGEDKEGILLSWHETTNHEKTITTIGHFNLSKKSLKELFTFNLKTNCIQGSLVHDKQYLALVTKEEQMYFTHLVNIESKNISKLDVNSSNQIMVQFVESTIANSKTNTIKLLILTHKKSILLYKISINETSAEMSISSEEVAQAFLWAQWDFNHQTLYLIHKKQRNTYIQEDELNKTKTTSNFSCLQFHDKMQHESVLNIPLNLPRQSSNIRESIYEDDAVPLRVHDHTLDLIVLTRRNGAIYICYHYIYQPAEMNKEFHEDDMVTISYTVTVFHHSCILHGTIPEIAYKRAKTIRPFFTFAGNHLIVYVPDICVQLLDVGDMHEPCCHIILHPFSINIEASQMHLANLLINDVLVNLATLDIIQLKITEKLLIKSFKGSESLNNKLSILHYLIVHCNNFDLALELTLWQMAQQQNMYWSKLLRELLIGQAFAITLKSLPQHDMMIFLPMTIQNPGEELKVAIGNFNIFITQDVLQNASMMLLSPQQRITYKKDFWVLVWEHLMYKDKTENRFQPDQFASKFNLSLHCSQVDELIAGNNSQSLHPQVIHPDENLCHQKCFKKRSDEFPFEENDFYAANYQEYIIAANQRELNAHILQGCKKNKREIKSEEISNKINLLINWYIAAQVNVSRKLCLSLCNTFLKLKKGSIKGYKLILNMDQDARLALFIYLDRYYNAVNMIGFPYPQGFIIFFTLLGYKVLRFELFLKYIQNGICKIQTEFPQTILSDYSMNQNEVHKLLKFIYCLSRKKIRYIVQDWSHKHSYMVRARKHSSDVLSGIVPQSSINQEESISYDLNTKTLFFAFKTFIDLLMAKECATNVNVSLLLNACIK